MVSIKTDDEVKLIKHAGHINHLCHKLLESSIKPGITTKELDKIAYDFITQNDCYPSCLGYEGYPASICTSVNEEVVHGIPSDRKLKNGDIISIDICVTYKGYVSDHAWTYKVGSVSKEKEELLKNTEKALYEGIKQVKEGAKIGDIGHAIESYAHKHHLGVVEELVGHGVGLDLHEEPDVPNYGHPHTGMTLKAGMTIAIEPMLNLGTRKVWMLDDDWTIITQDNKPSAHFEHTVLVTKDGYEILTGE